MSPTQAAQPGDRLTYTARETARLLGVSVRSVHNYVNRGALAAVRLPGRFLVTKDSLDKLLASASAPAPTTE